MADGGPLDTLSREEAPAGSPRATGVARRWVLASVASTCGALAVAAVLAPTGSASPSAALGWLLFLGSSVHVASTGWLASLADVRACARHHTVRYLAVPAVLVIGGAILFAVLRPRETTWVLLGFFAWQFFHFAKQNVGVAMLAGTSSAAGALSATERRAITGAGIAGIVALLARPELLQVRAPSVPGPWFDLSGLAFLGIVVVGLCAVARRERERRPAAFCAAYAAALCFSLPIFVSASPYAAIGGMTIAHGAQYLLLVGLVAVAPRQGSRLVRLAVLANVAILGGVALRATSHLHGAAPVGRALFGAYLGLAAAHFVIDAGLWRRGDPWSRRFLERSLPDLLCPDGRRVTSGRR